MRTLALAAAAAAYATLEERPVILMEVSIHDGADIARLPSVIPADDASALFDGPVMLDFDNVSQAARVFNEIVRETVTSLFDCAYTFTLINGRDAPIVHSNIDGRYKHGLHPVALAHFGRMETMLQPTASFDVPED